jgi:hypothetical protein
VALLSASALAYEILLTRLFSLAHWHHLVSMIISLALLGYGASGTFLSLLQNRLERHFRGLFLGNAVLFALGSVLGFELARQLPLNPLALPWDGTQMLYLVAVYTLAAVPFFGAANCIGLALWRYRERNHQVYAVDLAGAGLGAIGIIGLLHWLYPGAALGLIAGVAALAVLLAAWELRLPRQRLLYLALALLLAAPPVYLAVDWQVPGADYKDLSRSLSVAGAAQETRTADPHGVISVVRNEQVPLRHAPGLSLSAGVSPPPQLGLFIDGDAAGAITRFDGRTPPAFLAALPSALPYRLLERPDVLVLGAGGGDSVLQALGGAARHVTAVTRHAPLAQLLREQYREFNGGLFLRPDVQLVTAEPRAYAESTAQRFDLIQMNLVGGGGIGGLQSHDEAFAYTLEAFDAYLARLAPGGMLAVTRWVQLPPRESLRLVATAREALARAGAADPAEHLVLVRTWKTFTLLVSKAPLPPEASVAVRTFARDLGFDLVWYPGIKADEVNRYHRLDEPLFHTGVQAILGPQREAFIAGYPFHIEPVSDDRPYFHRFTRASTVPELLRLPAGSGFGQIDWGYGFLLATLAQALLLAVLLIILPLALAHGHRAGALLRSRILGYFALLGIGFLFVEIAFIQRFRLFLGDPLYATAVVLAGFLVFAGLGSWLSRVGSPRLRPRLAGAVIAIVSISLAYLWLLPLLFEALVHWPLYAKAGVTLLLIAPLAVPMGMPFPLGLAELGARDPALLPWAWGINGSFSVVSAVAAPLVAMEWGFSGLILVSVGLYAAVPWIFRDTRVA